MDCPECGSETINVFDQTSNTRRWWCPECGSEYNYLTRVKVL